MTQTITLVSHDPFKVAARTESITKTEMDAPLRLAHPYHVELEVPVAKIPRSVQERLSGVAEGRQPTVVDAICAAYVVGEEKFSRLTLAIREAGGALRPGLSATTDAICVIRELGRRAKVADAVIAELNKSRPGWGVGAAHNDQGSNARVAIFSMAREAQHATSTRLAADDWSLVAAKLDSIAPGWRVGMERPGKLAADAIDWLARGRSSHPDQIKVRAWTQVSAILDQLSPGWQEKAITTKLSMAEAACSVIREFANAVPIPTFSERLEEKQQALGESPATKSIVSTMEFAVCLDPELRKVIDDAITEAVGSGSTVTALRDALDENERLDERVRELSRLLEKRDRQVGSLNHSLGKLEAAFKNRNASIEEMDKQNVHLSARHSEDQVQLEKLRTSLCEAQAGERRALATVEKMNSIHKELSAANEQLAHRNMELASSPSSEGLRNELLKKAEKIIVHCDLSSDGGKMTRAETVVFDGDKVPRDEQTALVYLEKVAVRNTVTDGRAAHATMYVPIAKIEAQRKSDLQTQRTL